MSRREQLSRMQRLEEFVSFGHVSLGEQLDRVERLLERLDAAVVVREPGNARAAEAFDGLRKQIIQSGKSHRSHVAHLLSLSDSIEKGADVRLLRDRVEDFLTELGIERTTDVTTTEWFEIVEGDGPRLECIEPAIIERIDGGLAVIVRPGRARRLPVLESSIPERSPNGTSEAAQAVDSSGLTGDLAIEEPAMEHQATLSHSNVANEIESSLQDSAANEFETSSVTKEEDNGSDRD